MVDYWDQRVLEAIFSQYVNADVLKTMGYCLSGSDNRYIMPIGYSQMDYITFVEVNILSFRLNTFQRKEKKIN